MFMTRLIPSVSIPCPIDAKTNEIPVAQKALRGLSLKGCIVTFVALHTQTDTIGHCGADRRLRGRTKRQPDYHRQTGLPESEPDQ